MKTRSIWEEYYQNTEENKVSKNLDIDVAIIGGGITGLSIGYYLKDINLKTCIFESNRIGHGITSKTTAKITFLQEGNLSKVAKIYNNNTARKYYDSQKIAIEEILEIINSNKIKCDLKQVDSYYFASKKSDIKKIKEEESLLKLFQEDIEIVSKLPDGLNTFYGLKCHNTYVFNPIKYLYSLTNIIKGKVSLYENSKVTKINRENNHFILYINNHQITAKKVIIASHYPYFLFPYLMPLKCSLEKSYIGCFKTKNSFDFSAISSGYPTISIRYIENNYKLILTSSHNLASKQDDTKNFQVLKEKEPDYLWSNIDIITKDYLPIIGAIEENMYIATGYNTWGMTNATIAGKIIADLIQNKENIYAKLFNPKRHNNLKTIIKYPLYGILNSYAFISSKINGKNSAKIKYTKLDGVDVAVYKDKFGKSHIVKTKCPHLGCTLKFNEIEKTWDCPCHGSRFDIDGHVISGPSNYDISLK